MIGRSVISETVSAMIYRMSDSTSFSARQRGRGGRPSKGPRATMTVRCPEPLAEAIETARAGSGLTTNDFVVGMLAKAAAAGLFPAAGEAGQDCLPLTA
jgi:predicted HicB family RNase H-like nuclease